jgi:hypothetical protein
MTAAVTTADQVAALREWQRRQQSAPDGLRRILAERQRIHLAADAERRARIEAESREIARSLRAFDAEIDRILGENGCEWLAPYRVPDADWVGVNHFTLDNRYWRARFDPAEIGLHPIVVTLELHGDPLQWTLRGIPFAVNPNGRAWPAHPTLAEAVEAATQFIPPI